MQAGVVGTRMNWTEIFTAPLEHAQQIAAYASPKTTKLYDRTSDTISLDEIERVVI